MKSDGEATTQAQAEGAGEGELTVDQAAGRMVALEDGAATGQEEAAGSTQPAAETTPEAHGDETVPETEPQAEESETPAEAGTDDADEQGGEEHGADDGTPHWFRRRIDKLTSRAKTAEAKLAEQERELQELRAKVASAPSAEVLMKSGLPEGYASKEEADVVARDQELANGLAYLRANKAEFVREVGKMNPDLTPEELNDRYYARRDQLMEERLATGGRAAAIRERVANELRADIVEGRKRRGATVTPAAAAAAAQRREIPQNLRQKLRPVPSNVIPSNSGAVAQSVRQPGKKGVTRDQFKARADEIGDVEAAAEALSATMP